MTDIDWSKAPHDATHYLPESKADYECWAKPGYSMRLRSQKEWHADSAINDDIRDGTAIPRIKQWSGPQDGLPPVGELVEAGIPHVSGHDGENRSIIWIEGRVIAYHDIKGKTYAWFAEDDGFYPPGIFEFRPIRTQAQIEADERERAACDMFEVIDSTLPHVCGEEAMRYSRALYTTPATA